MSKNLGLVRAERKRMEDKAKVHFGLPLSFEPQNVASASMDRVFLVMPSDYKLYLGSVIYDEYDGAVFKKASAPELAKMMEAKP